MDTLARAEAKPNDFLVCVCRVGGVGWGSIWDPSAGEDFAPESKFFLFRVELSL